MPLLTDVRSIFRRRTRARIQPEESRNRAAAIVDGEPHADGVLSLDVAVETKPSRSATNGKAADEVVSMVRRIGEHLDSQTKRSERMIQLLDDAPDAIQSLPEIQRGQARLLEAFHEHLDQTRERDRGLSETLDRMTDASGRQADVLALIQQQLDASGQTAERISDTMSALRQSLGALADAGSRSADTLSAIAESASRREADLDFRMGRLQRWMVLAAVCCGIAAVAVLATVLG